MVRKGLFVRTDDFAHLEDVEDALRFVVDCFVEISDEKETGGGGGGHGGGALT